MPVFDFKNSPAESKTPECTYTVFYTDNAQPSARIRFSSWTIRQGSSDIIPTASLPIPSSVPLLSFRVRRE